MSLAPAVAPHPALHEITIRVHGDPASQGSMDSFPFQRKDGSLGVRMQHRKTQKAKIGNWRADVKAAVQAALAETPGWEGPLEGPLSAVIHFARPPVKLPRRVRWHGVLVEAAHRPWQRPDLDKLVRSTFDALTAAGLWKDDAQVVMLTTSKAYAGGYGCELKEPGAAITVSQLSPVRLDEGPALPFPPAPAEGGGCDDDEITLF
jgi:Holliday junction resolvase RusA-like endonuclease